MKKMPTQARRGSLLMLAGGCAPVLALAQGASGAAMPAAAAASAPAELQQVVVTSERRAQSLQKTAVSISVLDGDELQREGKTAIADIVQSVPGVVFQAINPDGAPMIAIRGVGTDNPLGNAGVALYVDGIALRQGALQFYDLERVEVLRGPQGTLYGRGAPAGAVNFVTKDPTQQAAAEAQLELGSHSLVRATGVANVPLGSDWALRVGVNAIRRDGSFDNGLGDADERNARLKLRWAPDRRLSLVLGYTNYRSRGLGGGQVNLNADGSIPEHIVSNAASVSGLGTHEDYEKFSAHLNWDFGPATLSYVGSWGNFEQDTTRFFGGNTNHAVVPTDRSVTHELRVASNARQGLAWIAGAYAQDTRLDGVTTVSNAIFSGDFANHTRQTSRAVFAEATLPFGDQWRATLGARHSRDTFDSDFPQTFTFLIPAAPDGPPFPDLNFASVPAAGRFTRTDYKLRLERAFGRDHMVYGGWSSGYRPGGAAGTGSGGTQDYGIEVNRAFEVGVKSRWLDGRAQLNASLFRYAYSGFQQPFQAAGSPFVTIESHPARMSGGELEAKWLATPDDQLALDLALLDASYRDSSLPVPHSPRVTAGLAYRHTFWLAGGANLRVGGDVKHQSSQYTNYNTTLDPAMFQRAYALVGLSADWESADGRYTVSGYVRNATDQRYKLTVNQGAGAGAPGIATISEPRTFGIVLGIRM